MKNKLIAIVLSFLLVLGAIPNTVFAVEESAQPVIETESPVKLEATTDTNVSLVEEVKALMKQADEILNSGKNLKEEYKKDLEAAKGLAELGLLTKDETTLTQVKAVFTDLISKLEENIIPEVNPIDALIEEIKAYIKQANEILNSDRKLKEEYKKNLSDIVAMAELGLLTKDETTLTSAKQVFEALLPLVDENTITEEPPVEEKPEEKEIK